MNNVKIKYINLPLQGESSFALRITNDRRMKIRFVSFGIEIGNGVLRRRQRDTTRIGGRMGDLAEERLQFREGERHGRRVNPGGGRRHPGWRIVAAGALSKGNTSIYVLVGEVVALGGMVDGAAAAAAPKQESPFQGVPPTPRHNQAVIGMYLGGRGGGGGTDGGKGALPPMHCQI